MLWSFTLTVSKGCPTQICAVPPAVPAISSFTTERDGGAVEFATVLSVLVAILLVVLLGKVARKGLRKENRDNGRREWVKEG